MNLVGLTKSLIGSKERVAISSTSPTSYPAGRISTDTAKVSTFSSRVPVVSPPPNTDDLWKLKYLDYNNLDVYSPKELLDILIDLSPEIGYGLWQFQRMCNPGWECKVYYVGSENREHRAGKKHIDSVLAMLKDRYGSVDVLLGRYFIGAFTRGAFCSEIVLDGRETVDLVPPDPHSIRFRKIQEGVRGEVWQPGQMQAGEFIPLDIPTFKYLPVDPAPASPYGRSIASPALFTAVFALSLWHDIKRVIMQQGYKRMDITLDTEVARENFRFDPQGTASLGQYIREAMNVVRSVYSTLKPDDAFIHTDLFQLGSPVGTIDSDSIGAIDRIIERLEKTITRALKSNGVVMDTGANLNETDSNRKWEIYVAGIKSLQHHCEAMLESQLNVSLRAAGIQARVVWRFSELRAAEMFRDEQTRALRIQNARNEYEAGFVSQDEAANSAVNHDADQPEPRKPLVNLEFNQDNNSGNEELTKPEVEVNRMIRLIDQRFEEMMRENGYH